MVPFFQMLENSGIRAHFSVTDSTETFVGGLFGVTGDDISQREIMGKTGPLSQASSRFFARPRARFPVLLPYNKLEWHDVEASRRVVDEIARIQQNPEGHKTYLDELIRMVGMNRKVRFFGVSDATKCITDITAGWLQSGLWNLRVFSKSYFTRFFLCRLHLIEEGNFKRKLRYHGRKMGRDKCEGSWSLFQFCRNRLLTINVV